VSALTALKGWDEGRGGESKKREKEKAAVVALASPAGPVALFAEAALGSGGFGRRYSLFQNSNQRCAEGGRHRESYRFLKARGAKETETICTGPVFFFLFPRS